MVTEMSGRISDVSSGEYLDKVSIITISFPWVILDCEITILTDRVTSSVDIPGYQPGASWRSVLVICDHFQS